MCTVPVLVLAKSIKHGNYCVAGKDIRTGEWVRPVSSAEGNALTAEQARYRNYYGRFDVKPLKVFAMAFSSFAPLQNQPENRIVANQIWQQCPPFVITELTEYLDSPNDLWGEGNRIQYSRIESSEVTISQSLYLVRVEALQLVSENGNRRAHFRYSDVEYDLPVTDPNFDNLEAQNKQGIAILCISLGENFNEFCYKIVAGIF